MSGTVQKPGGAWRSNKFFVPLVLLLLAGAAARVPLVMAGGRFFISDEGRYLHGFHLYCSLLRGEWEGASAVLRHSDNWGFILLSALTTAAQHGMSFFTAHSKWPADAASLQPTLFLGAIVLSMAPVVAVWVLHRLARRLGADEREAFCCALILSVSNTSFYFSRHLFPYDASIAVMLGALLVAAGPPGATRSVVAGVLGGVAFHLYNAYWYLLPLVVVARWAFVGETRRKFVEPSLTLGGLVAAAAVPYAWGWWTYGDVFLKSTVIYGRSVVQGLYREGWSMPWEYLWHSEGLFGLVAVSLPIVVWVRLRPQEATPTRVRYAFVSAVAMYLVWIAVSSVGHLFVMNARTVKPLVPVLCLLSGWGLASLFRLNLRLAWAVGVLVVALGALNLVPHYWIVFPRSFEAGVASQVGNPKRTASVSGSYFSPKIPPVSAPDYLMVNAHYLYPVRSTAPVPAGTTVFSAAHPLEYLPYQYDGFTPRQRQVLRSSDLRMKLLQLADPAQVPDLPPADFQSTNEDWPDGFDSEASLTKKPNPPVR